jgi:hypothetical protein
MACYRDSFTSTFLVICYPEGAQHFRNKSTYIVREYCTTDKYKDHCQNPSVACCVNVCDVAGMRASLGSLETGIEIGTETVIVTATATVIVTVDSMDGTEDLKRTDHSLEETVSEWASRAEMTEEVLGTWQHLCVSSWCVYRDHMEQDKSFVIIQLSNKIVQFNIEFVGLKQLLRHYQYAIYVEFAIESLHLVDVGNVSSVSCFHLHS